MFSVCYGSWFDFERDWEDVKKAHSEHQILHVRYEDLKEVGSKLNQNIIYFRKYSYLPLNVLANITVLLVRF